MLKDFIYSVRFNRVTAPARYPGASGIIGTAVLLFSSACYGVVIDQCAVIADRTGGATNGENLPDQIQALQEQATCYREAGRSDESILSLQTALALAARTADKLALIRINGKLGQAFVNSGSYTSGYRYLTDGVAIAQESQLETEAAPLLNNLGVIEVARGQKVQAMTAFADSYRLAPENSALRTAAGINLARTLLENGSAAALPNRLAQTRGQANALPDSEYKASALLSLGEIYRQYALVGSEPGGARREAYDAYSSALELARRAEDKRMMSYAYGYLGRLYQDAGETEQALTFTRNAVMLAQEAESDDCLYLWEWQTGRQLRAQGDDDGALNAYRMAVDTLERARQDSAAPSQRKFREEILPVYLEYADLLLGANENRAQSEISDQSDDAQRLIERMKVAEVQNYFENQCVVPSDSGAQIRRRENTAVVYPLIFEDRTEVLVSLPGDLYTFSVDVDRETFTRQVEWFRRSLEAPDTDEYLTYGRPLYQWLIEPLEPILKEAGIKTLVFAPDGILRTIPLAALPIDDDFLIERYAVATTLGLTLIDAPDKIERAPVVLAGGLTESVQGFTALPSVADELRQISAVFPTTTFQDAEFQADSIGDQISAGEYSIVHIATHGQFQSDYQRSFLLAYDGVITMDQLEAVVRGQGKPGQPLDLLVLSACETAAGDELAALGLAGVAVKAGARSAVASLWRINDEATSLLIADFYRELKNPKVAKANALQNAQITLIDSERFHHPGYWGAFLLVGDWL
jgi:CHAT domain-containing protein